MSSTAIIIVNWNGKHLLGPCLRSLQQQTYRDFEVFLVDTHSSDGSADFVRENFKWVKVIQLKRNKAFTGGNNAAFREIVKDRSVKYIVTLNNDTVADKNWLKELVKAAKSDNKVGSCSSKVLYMKNKSMIDTAGIAIYRDGHAQSRHCFEKSSECNKKEEIFGASAVAALYKREALEKTGFFDERFYMYQEEVDLAWRLRYAGYKSLFVPGAVVYHTHSASSRPFSPLKAYYSERNRIWLIFKNFTWGMLLRAKYYTLKRYIALAKGAKRKKGPAGEFVKKYSFFRILMVLLKAYLVGIVMLPLFIPKRMRIQRMRKKNRIGRKEIDEWFKIFSTDAERMALMKE